MIAFYLALFFSVADIAGIANAMTTVTKHHKSGQQLFSSLYLLIL